MTTAMRSDRACDLSQWLQEAWQAPRNLLPFPIGEKGYTLPSLSALDLHKVTEDTVIGNVHIKASIHGPNFVLISKRQPPAFRINIIHGAGAYNNILVLGEKAHVIGDLFFNSIGGLVIIGDNIEQLSPVTFWMWSHNATAFWGSKATSNGTTLNVMGDNSSMIVGDDCMFAHNITIRNSDQHALIDMETGEVTNPSAGTLIEPHTWVCQDSLILKGVTVGFGSVIGAKSVVARDVPRFSLVAGSPASIKKNNISWHRTLTPPTAIKDALRSLASQVPIKTPDSSTT